MSGEDNEDPRVCVRCLQSLIPENDIKKGLISCESCSRGGLHVGCLTETHLAGDSFFVLRCCGADKISVLRSKVNWVSALVLALYNLRHSSAGRNGYFHWKYDLSTFLERNWVLIFGSQMKKRKTWLGTISGILSHWSGEIFKSGYQELGEPGWWKLMNKEALPVEIVEASVKQHSPTGKKIDMSLNQGSSKRRRSVQSEEMESSISKKICIDHKTTPIKSEFACLSSVKSEFGDRVDSESIKNESLNSSLSTHDLIESEGNRKKKKKNDWFKEVTPHVTSAELPQDLFNDDDEEEEEDDEFSSLNGDQFSSSLDGLLTSKNEDFLPRVEDLLTEIKTEPNDGLSNENEELYEEDKEDSGPDSPESRVSTPEPDPTIVLISEYEEERILNKLESCPALLSKNLFARQLRRKLIVRKAQRERGLLVFDLDATVIKLAGVSTYFGKISSDLNKLSDNDTTNPSIRRVLDRYLAHPRIWDSNSSLCSSFRMRLVGRDEYSKEILSPFTGRILKPYIRRDYETKPLKLRLLREIKARGKSCSDPRLIENYPIDYCYVQPHHIPAVNNLAEKFFWPGIDLTECLKYPDFSCVVLYRRIVIAFAFLVPDVTHTEAYISFIFTHPEWRGAGIAKFMLYHLIQTCMGKDITLHVSANNPAVLLYQKFGFKVEEYVLDFYDKYLPLNSKECKHALFLRLLR